MKPRKRPRQQEGLESMFSADRSEPNSDSSGGRGARPRGLDQRVEAARRALLNRPHFSLRLQLYLSFILALILAGGAATALVISFQQMEKKIHILGVVDDYVVEVEQARRFEKNFFLYGTNLIDAQENIFAAEKILTTHSEELTSIMGPGWGQKVMPQLRRYTQLLARLGELKRRNGSGKVSEADETVRMEVREQGQQLVAAAMKLQQKEQSSLVKIMSLSRQLLFYSLVLLLIFLIFNAYLLRSRMLGSITRFGHYAPSYRFRRFQPHRPHQGLPG